MQRPIVLVCFLALAIGSPLPSAQAVVSSGGVRGVVTDNSGAVIAGSSVTLVSGATGQTVTRTSNSKGIFVFPSQPVGTYKVEVTAAGFRKEIVEPVLVQVGQTTPMSVRMQPG